MNAAMSGSICFNSACARFSRCRFAFIKASLRFLYSAPAGEFLHLIVASTDVFLPYSVALYALLRSAFDKGTGRGASGADPHL